MKNDSILQKRIHNLSDEQLLKMINEASAYRLEAISYAQEELSRRGGVQAVSTRTSISQQHEEDKKREEHATMPLFLHIPIGRLIFMSIMSFGLYEMYWIYKNWEYIKVSPNTEKRPRGNGSKAAIRDGGASVCFSSSRRVKSLHADGLASGVWGAAPSPLVEPVALSLHWDDLGVGEEAVEDRSRRGHVA
jgi:hypothetical protein